MHAALIDHFLWTSTRYRSARRSASSRRSLAEVIADQVASVGGGFGIFAIFYVFLTAGEALSDRGLVSPALSMWGPNLLFTAAGLIGLVLVNRESGSTRGGDLQEVVEGLRGKLQRLRGRLPRRGA
jgi:hypothetical protein